MNKSFSSTGISKLVSILLQNKRDVDNPELSEFYFLDPSNQANIDERYREVLGFRITNSLPLVQPGSFLADTSVSGGPAFFARVLAAQGVERVFTEDLTSSSTSVSRNKLKNFIDKQALSIPTVPRTSFTEQVIETKHLLNSEPVVIPTEDTSIFKRLKGAHKYVRELSK